MSFIESYKSLEKLCGEILNDDRRISAYIDEMINTPCGSYLVKGWDEDLKKLKHYRWVRNQIVHEPDCTEANLCRRGDAEWLDNFYLRIINQTDPLALYAKAVKSRSTKQIKKSYSVLNTSTHTNTYTQVSRSSSKSSKKSGCLWPIVAALIVVFLIILVCIAH